MTKQTASIIGYCAICILIGSCFGQSNADNSEIVERDSEEEISLAFKRGVISIYQDSNNNLWIGSKEEGVCKYDGQSYTYFTTDDGLADNFVREIQEDHEGKIWFSTGQGYCYFDGQNFTTLSVSEELDYIMNSDYDHPNRPSDWELKLEDIWFPIHRDGILRYRSGQLDYLAVPIPESDRDYQEDRIREPYFFPYSPVTIFRDKQENLLIGTFNRGVIIYDGKEFEFHNPDNFGVGTVRGLFQDDKGDYWFGSNGGGLYQYDGENYRNLALEQQQTRSQIENAAANMLSRVWSIGQDIEGNMWFGTAESGLWKYDGHELTNYTMEDGLPSNFVETIYRDRTGKMWFCSGMNSNGKLYTYDGGSFEIID